jgi:hypothetical protein
MPPPPGKQSATGSTAAATDNFNRALHIILVTRRRTHAPTIAYIERRIREGKTRRQAIRCLKRYLARNLYRLLEHGAPRPLDKHRSICETHISVLGTSPAVAIRTARCTGHGFIVVSRQQQWIDTSTSK